jgi:dTDP-glucose 4,6-dehydratase
LTRRKPKPNSVGKPLTGWEEGLQKTVRWYQENQDWVDHIRSGAYREYYQKTYGASLK